MKAIRVIINCALVSCMALTASAQHTRSGYFNENYLYRYQMNPAMGNESGYVATPALGNINVAMNGTLHLTDILYVRDGHTVTFMNPQVSAAEVMSNIGTNNRIGANIDLNILSTGFKALGGYNTIAINAKANANINVPGALVSFLKEGITNKEYNISHLHGSANAYAEIALNHSHALSEQVRVGATVKVLLGFGNIDAKLNTARLNLSPDGWTISADGQLNANVKGLKYETSYDDDTQRDYVDNIKIDNTGLNGCGLAFDLGVVYTPTALRDWQFSASLLDLGFIRWNNNIEASTNGLQTFNTNNYTFSVEDDADNSFSDEWDKIKDDLAAIYQLSNNGDRGAQTRSLGATMHLGAQYTLPVYRPLTFGLLNTTRIQRHDSWTEFRLSANCAPHKLISVGANLGVGTFGCAFGWIVNFHAGPFNLFAAMDHTPGRLAKQGVPLNSNLSVNMGLDWLF